ncbi:hypothetical protein DUNSADRAFT_3032, partial [Dunaliella salina]
MQCKPEKGKGCVDYRESAAGPGSSSVTIVRIVNQTEIGAAKKRLLAFSGVVSRECSGSACTHPCTGQRLLAFSGVSTMNETMNSKVTSCKPEPDWEAAAQSFLKMGPVYYDVAVWIDDFWLHLWGSAGGAYSSFFEICAVLLVTYALVSKIYKKTLRDKVARMRQVACSSWAPRQSYAPDPEGVESKPGGSALAV